MCLAEQQQTSKQMMTADAATPPRPPSSLARSRVLLSLANPSASPPSHTLPQCTCWSRRPPSPLRRRARSAEDVTAPEDDDDDSAAADSNSSDDDSDGASATATTTTTHVCPRHPIGPPARSAQTYSCTKPAPPRRRGSHGGGVAGGQVNELRKSLSERSFRRALQLMMLEEERKNDEERRKREEERRKSEERERRVLVIEVARTSDFDGVDLQVDATAEKNGEALSPERSNSSSRCTSPLEFTAPRTLHPIHIHLQANTMDGIGTTTTTPSSSSVSLSLTAEVSLHGPTTTKDMEEAPLPPGPNESSITRLLPPIPLPLPLPGDESSITLLNEDAAIAAAMSTEDAKDASVKASPPPPPIITKEEAKYTSVNSPSPPPPPMITREEAKDVPINAPPPSPATATAPALPHTDTVARKPVPVPSVASSVAVSSSHAATVVPITLTPPPVLPRHQRERDVDDVQCMRALLRVLIHRRSSSSKRIKTRRTVSAVPANANAPEGKVGMRKWIAGIFRRR